MDCGKVKELLLSDYMDGEVGEGERLALEGHLGLCSSCLAFQRESLSAAKSPFEGMGGLTPDKAVWEGVSRAAVRPARQEVRAAQEVRRPGGLFRLKPLFGIAAAASVFAVMILWGGWVGDGPVLKTALTKPAAEEATELMAFFEVEGATVREELLTDLGTRIEEYFL